MNEIIIVNLIQIDIKQKNEELIFNLKCDDTLKILI